MDSASNRKTIRRKEKAAHLASVQRREVITQVMSTATGRQWLWDILSSCHIFVTTFNGEALQSAFMEGQRASGLAILADIMLACPDQYIQAMREANERSNTDERRSSTESNGGDSRSSDPDPEDRYHGDGDPYEFNYRDDDAHTDH